MNYLKSDMFIAILIMVTLIISASTAETRQEKIERIYTKFRMDCNQSLGDCDITDPIYGADFEGLKLTPEELNSN